MSYSQSNQRPCHIHITNSQNTEARKLFSAGPGGIRSIRAFSQSSRFKELDTDRKAGVIRSADHAFTSDGGLAVLRGNLAPEGAVAKITGHEGLEFTGTAKCYHGEEAAMAAIMGISQGRVRRRLSSCLA